MLATHFLRIKLTSSYQGIQFIAIAEVEKHSRESRIKNCINATDAAEQILCRQPVKGLSQLETNYRFVTVIDTTCSLLDNYID